MKNRLLNRLICVLLALVMLCFCGCAPAATEDKDTAQAQDAASNAENASDTQDDSAAETADPAEQDDSEEPAQEDSEEPADADAAQEQDEEPEEVPVPEFENDAQRIKYDYESYNDITRPDGVYVWPVDVPEDNPFVYLTAEEAIEMAESGTGVVFYGSSWCRTCRMVITLIMDALEDERAAGNEYVETIYYFDTDLMDENDPLYDEVCEKVLGPMGEYVQACDEHYTNVSGYDGLIEYYAGEDVDVMDPSIYKAFVAFYAEGKLLGVNVGTTPHYVNQETPPTDEDSAAFTEVFWESAKYFGTDLCGFC